MTLSENEDSIQLITFNIGQKLFGINLLTIREIVRDPEIEAIDKGPAFIDGIVRVRGEVIPVIDLKRRMSDSETPGQGEHVWIMIANTDNYVAGFKVDAVNRILKTNPDEILTAPDLIQEGLRRPYIRGVCDSEIGMLVVLDFERLLSSDEISELNQTGAQN